MVYVYSQALYSLSKDEVYNYVQMMKHMDNLKIQNNCMNFDISKKSKKNQLISIRKFLQLPENVHMTPYIFLWFFEFVEKYDTNNWKAYFELFTSRGGKLCYHYLLSPHWCNVSSPLYEYKNEYNKYILNHIDKDSFNNGRCVCQSETDTGIPYDLMEGFMIDVFKDNYAHVNYTGDDTIIEEGQKIIKGLVILYDVFNQYIEWGIPVKTNKENSYYPIDQFDNYYKDYIDNLMNDKSTPIYYKAIIKEKLDKIKDTVLKHLK